MPLLSFARLLTGSLLLTGALYATPGAAQAVATRVPLAARRGGRAAMGPAGQQRAARTAGLTTARAPQLERQLAVPGLLIGLGLLSAMAHSPVASAETAEEIGEHFPTFHTHLDDYLQYAPFAGLATATLLGVPTGHAPLRILTTTLQAELLMATTVTALKHFTHVTRPDGSTPNSFPSGHTAQAFVAATVLATELRAASP